MHTYRKSWEDQDQKVVFKVGFEQDQHGSRPWRAIKEFKHEREAAAFVSFLNGGVEPPGVDYE